jgi:hypothetical protein
MKNGDFLSQKLIKKEESTEPAIIKDGSLEF